MIIYTIGFTKKSAEEFFSILDNNNVGKIIDIRLNNSNQLAGFSKGNDLKFFLNRILNIKYSHELIFAPTKEILDDYKKKCISWNEYELMYTDLLDKRNIKKYLDDNNILDDSVCFLCSE